MANTPPTITSLSPSSYSSLGGERVKVYGSNFGSIGDLSSDSTNRVRIDSYLMDLTALHATINSDGGGSYVEFVAPAMPPGTYEFTLLKWKIGDIVVSNVLYITYEEPQPVREWIYAGNSLLRQVDIFDSVTKTKVSTMDFSLYPSPIVVCPTGEYFYSIGDGIRKYKSSDMSQVDEVFYEEGYRLIPGHNGHSISHDGTYLYVGRKNISSNVCSIRKYNTSDLSLATESPSVVIEGFVVSSKNNSLFIWTGVGNMVRYNATTLAQVKLYTPSIGSYYPIRFSSDYGNFKLLIANVKPSQTGYRVLDIRRDVLSNEYFVNGQNLMNDSSQDISLKNFIYADNISNLSIYTINGNATTTPSIQPCPFVISRNQDVMYCKSTSFGTISTRNLSSPGTIESTLTNGTMSNYSYLRLAPPPLGFSSSSVSSNSSASSFSSQISSSLSSSSSVNLEDCEELYEVDYELVEKDTMLISSPINLPPGKTLKLEYKRADYEEWEIHTTNVGSGAQIIVGPLQPALSYLFRWRWD